MDSWTSCNYNDFQNHYESHHHRFGDWFCFCLFLRRVLPSEYASQPCLLPGCLVDHTNARPTDCIFKLLCIYLLTLHCSWLNFDFSLVFMLHPLITNFNRRGNLRGNKQSKSIRTAHPQNCTETNLDMEWQGVNNDGNFEQGPIAEKGTDFVKHIFCKSGQLVNDFMFSNRHYAVGSTEEIYRNGSIFLSMLSVDYKPNICARTKEQCLNK